MESKILTVSSLTQGSAEVPFIRIRGKWLLQAGFHCGDRISVQIVEPGFLAIQKIQERK